MKSDETISRRDALKRMSKTAVAVAVAAVLSSAKAVANTLTSTYVDRCYNDYSNYDNYTNHKDYYNYGNYRDYSDHRDYRNYSNYQNSVE